MKLKKLFTATAALLLGIGGTTLSATSATAATHSFQLDCATLDAGETVFFAARIGDTGSISMTNCSTMSDTYNPIWLEDITSLPANSTIHFVAQSQALTSSFWVSSHEVDLRILGSRPVPEGVRSSVQNMIIPSNYASTTKFEFTSDDTGDGETQLGTEVSCPFQTGPHPYVTKTFTVSATGNYTFRAIEAVSEEPRGMNSPSAFESGLILYSQFSSSNPAQNVVGCGLGWDNGNPNTYDETASGQQLSRGLTEFTSHLSPGTYTLVFTPYAYQQDFDWTEGAQSNKVEVWGKRDAITLEGLSNTGYSADSFWLALGLLLLGFALKRISSQLTK